MDVTIDPVFKCLIPPLSDEEKRQLEENIKAENGARDPLVVWKETGILLDGHHRYEICARLGLGFKVTQLSFADRESAADWVDANMLGRRSLTMEGASLLRGRRYQRAKRKQGGTGANQHILQSGHNVHSAPPVQSGHSDHFAKTAERLAAEYGVSEKTIRRDGEFAHAVEAVKAVAPDIEQSIAAGTAPSRTAVVQAAKIAESEPEKARAILNGHKPMPTPTDPETPWAAFESAIRTDVAKLRAVAASLRKTLGYDSTTHTLTNPWARGYSYAGVVAGLNQYIRLLEDGLPVADPAEPCGWTTAHRQEIKEKAKAA